MIFARHFKKFFLITVPVLAILLLLCEFLIFRFILPASDWPYRSTIQGPDDVVRYVYKDSGMFREGTFLQGFPNEITGTYKINREGWNSHREYFEARSTNTRIAVIGDSFVDAHQVKVDECFAAVLEKELLAKGYDLEVYRFGFGAAPLSQYLHMMRYAKQKFDPDIYIINILANDFVASIYGLGNWDRDFLQLKQQGDTWVEIKPKPYVPSRWRMLLKRSATFRYLYQNLSLKRGFPTLNDLFKKRAREKEFQMNVNVKSLQRNREVIQSLSRYVFTEFNRQIKPGRKLLLVMDGNRPAIYAGNNLQAQEASLMMAAVAAEARSMNLPVIELEPVFLQDYKKHGQRLDFPHDYHWNQRGHELVGKTIAAYLEKL